MANNQVMQSKNQSVSSLLESYSYKKKFEEVLGKKAPGFIASIISASKNNLLDCNPVSTLKAAMTAATLDLPIDPNLGFAYLIPYNDKKEGKITQFQMGYKGYIQLAIRSGQYKTINAIEVYEGEIRSVNRLTGEIEFETDEKLINRDFVVGYVGYFKLINGFEKTIYMSRDEMERHAKKYSQSYRSNKDWVVKGSLWTTDFDGMAVKTIIKRLISKYGIMSIDMQTAILNDQSSVDENNNPVYVDNQVSQEISQNANKTVLNIDEADKVVETQHDIQEVKEKEVQEVLGQAAFEDEECPF